MKSIGDQVKEFRAAHGLSTSQFAVLAKTKRQNIEQLEAAGNRIPKYIGSLAEALGKTADEVLATAGLRKPIPPAKPVKPKGAFLKEPTPEELELLDHFRHLLGSDRRALLGQISQLAAERMAQREELLQEAGLDRIRQRAARAQGWAAQTSVEIDDPELRQESLDLDDGAAGSRGRK